jgi:hypothetical protein
MAVAAATGRPDRTFASVLKETGDHRIACVPPAGSHRDCARSSRALTGGSRLAHGYHQPMNAQERGGVFSSDDLDLLAQEAEVDIETWPAPGRSRRTTIWIVVVGGIPYVRSVRGTRGRWWRDLRAEPHGAVHAAGRRIAFMAVPADDAASIAACTAGLEEKYARDPAVKPMLKPDILATTLRLEPA